MKLKRNPQLSFDFVFTQQELDVLVSQDKKKRMKVTVRNIENGVVTVSVELNEILKSMTA